MPIPAIFRFGRGTGGKPCFCQSHLGKFGAEALFYMFYNMPKENNQVPLGCVGQSAVAMLAFKGLLWMVSSPSAMGQICCIAKLHYPVNKKNQAKLSPFFSKRKRILSLSDLSLRCFTSQYFGPPPLIFPHNHDLTAARPLPPKSCTPTGAGEDRAVWLKASFKKAGFFKSFWRNIMKNM